MQANFSTKADHGDIVVISATNYVSERSASALCHVTTYLRSTMAQGCLNHLLVLHGHKDRTDNLSLTKSLQEFVDCRERKNGVFGKFS